MKATALDKAFGVIPPDIAARLDGDENLPVLDYFREPTLDELIVHHAEYIESWDEGVTGEADVMWSIHMALVSIRILAKMRDEQGGRPHEKSLEETARRVRTIRWKCSTDRIAKTMASERYDGNVSRLIQELVLREHRDPRIPVAE